MTRRLIDMRNWLDQDQQPTRTYYFELHSGQRGESDSPLTLFDLLCDPYYSDCDDRTTQIVLLGQMLRDISSQTLSFQKIRATVYSGLGPFYDNMISRFPDEVAEAGQLQFDNPDDPVILDFWDEWTTMASLIKCGYLKLYEKVPTFGSARQDSVCDGCHFYNSEDNSCSAWQAQQVRDRMQGCAVWTASGDLREEYREVKPEDLVEPTWKVEYVPIPNRTQEYERFRL